MGEIFKSHFRILLKKWSHRKKSIHNVPTILKKFVLRNGSTTAAIRTSVFFGNKILLRAYKKMKNKKTVYPWSFKR
jgi:hypothetical protein